MNIRYNSQMFSKLNKDKIAAKARYHLDNIKLQTQKPTVTIPSSTTEEKEIDVVPIPLEN